MFDDILLRKYIFSNLKHHSNGELFIQFVSEYFINNVCFSRFSRAFFLFHYVYLVLKKSFQRAVIEFFEEGALPRNLIYLYSSKVLITLFFCTFEMRLRQQPSVSSEVFFLSLVLPALSTPFAQYGNDFFPHILKRDKNAGIFFFTFIWKER